MPSPRAAQGAGLMLFFVMLFLSGASVPMEVMSDTMKSIGDFLPLTYGVDLLQAAWSGGTWTGPPRSCCWASPSSQASSACACTAGASAPRATEFLDTSASRFLTAACTFLSSSSP